MGIEYEIKWELEQKMKWEDGMGGLKMEWEWKNFYCLGGDGVIVASHVSTFIFYACAKSPSIPSNHNIRTQTTTSRLNPQHVHSNHNICSQNTTSTLKQQHLHSDQHIYTQTKTSTLKPKHLY